MLCQKCGKNPATTHIHSVINGVVTELNLCGNCAAQQGYNSPLKNNLVDMLFSMFGDSLKGNNALSENRCNCCNASLNDIASTGKVGCSECYKLFSSQLVPYIKRIHGSTQHIGKKLNKAVMVVSNNDRLADMRKKLTELVKTEKYEDAAVLRDEIKKLEKENNNE